MAKDPLRNSKYMGGCPSIAPLHVWPGMTVEQLVDKVYARSSYQSRNLAKAAMLMTEAQQNPKNSFWIAMSGAATPAGLGGLVAQFIDEGRVDGVVSTGANIYHGLHYIFGLPVRQGSPQVNDEELRKEGTTRIYDTTIRNRETLKAQDMLVRTYARNVFRRLKPPFSTATLLYEFGKELLEDKLGFVKNTEGSVILSAARNH